MSQEPSNKEEEQAKPVFGVSGRKIIYDKDGKPCNTLLDFKSAMGGGSSTSQMTSKSPVKDNENFMTNKNESILKKNTKACPPDVEQLGRSSWTLLHSIAATYPETPSSKEQSDLKQFIKLFGNFYPCWFCGEDFQKYTKVNEPKVATQDEFGKWLCDAHNEVNKKLGKPIFDCNLWKQRWKDGWEDGRCD